MRIWISKYALTKGIFEVEAAQERSMAGKSILMVANEGPRHRNIYSGSEWHHTREEAVERAKQMQITQINYLKRKLAEVEKLRFE